MISICIATCNRKDDVFQTVRECLEIEGDKIEVIVSDNNSTDGTYNLLKTIKDPRFHYYKNDKNIGPAMNFIRVLSLARHPYAFLLNDRDSVNKNNLLELIYFLERAERTPSLIYLNYKGDNVFRKSVIFSKYLRYISTDEILKKSIFTGGYISEVVYNMSVFKKAQDSFNSGSYLYGIYSYRCAELAMYRYGNILLFGRHVAEFRREAKPDEEGWKSADEIRQMQGDQTDKKELIKDAKKAYWTIYSRNRQIEGWIEYFLDLYGIEKTYEYIGFFLNLPSKYLYSYLVSISSRFDSKWSRKLTLLYEEEETKRLKDWLQIEIPFYRAICKRYFTERSSISISVAKLGNELKIYISTFKFYLKKYLKKDIR